MKDLVMPVVVTVLAAFVLNYFYSGLDIKGRPSVSECTGECYAAYLADNGSVVDQLRAKQAEAAKQSPAELGKATYSTVCQACHGDKGQGVVGPQLSGRDAAFVLEALAAYKKGETRGNQSALMWPQAQTMDQPAMDNVAAFIETL